MNTTYDNGAPRIKT